jgi:RHS repeat-associated protein
MTTVTYTYDVFGNRIEQDEWVNGTGLTVTRFAYDGQNVWADLSSTNGLVMRRLFLDGVDQPYARITSGGTVAWYLADHLGSIRDVLNAAGTMVLDQLAYDPYGQISSETNPTNGDRYGYAGGERDSNTGLDHFGERYFDPKSGRWIRRDPLGFGGGDQNLYRYVGNDPVNKLDPTGLQEATIERIGGREVKLADSTFPFGKGNGTVKAYEKATARGKKTGKTLDDVIWLEFTSTADAVTKVHWLQFIYRYQLDANNMPVEAISPVTKAGKTVYFEYGEKGRHVDANSLTDPFFDTHNPNDIRTQKCIAFFDKPGNDKEAGTLEDAAVFDTYLFAGNKIVYHISWKRLAKFEDGQWNVSYADIKGEKMKVLPAWLKGDTLPGGYLKYDKRTLKLSEEIRYPNPIPKENR